MTVERTVMVLVESGLHARPAATFVKAARTFASEISLSHGDRTANCKSMLSLLTLDVRQGSSVSITATGEDEADAVSALIAVLAGVDPGPDSGAGTQ